MKRLAAIAIGIALGFSVFGGGNKEKVLLFIRHGTSSDIDFVVEQEANVMISMLEEAGFAVDVATDSGEVIKSRNGKSLLRPDVRIADADVNDYVGIVLPCMSKGSVRHGDPREIVAVLQAAFAMGKPVAAQHASITFRGKQASWWATISQPFEMESSLPAIPIRVQHDTTARKTRLASLSSCLLRLSGTKSRDDETVGVGLPAWGR